MFISFSSQFQLKWISEPLIHCNHCSHLEPMIPRPNQNPNHRLLTDLIVHTAVVMSAMGEVDILKPFNSIMFTPADLKVCLF